MIILFFIHVFVKIKKHEGFTMKSLILENEPTEALKYMTTNWIFVPSTNDLKNNVQRKKIIIAQIYLQNFSDIINIKC